MHESRYESDRAFEDDVRRVLEAVYDLPAGACHAHRYPNGKEVDGRVEVDGTVHLLMATRSTREQKVKDDIGKLHRAKVIERQDGADDIVLWMVMEQTPEGDQSARARDNRVRLRSLDQLRSQFFNSREYLYARLEKPFGSARNPTNDSHKLPEDAYVRLPMSITEHVTSTEWGKPVADITARQIANRLNEGEIIVMLAPFGSGKSVTTREVFRSLRADALTGRKTQTPVSLNLRDHWGERYAQNLLLSHANDLGLKRPNNLIRAWRTGATTLLLDGFDEVASQYVTDGRGRDFMREARYDSLQGVRDLVGETPAETGILLVGRDHYFNSPAELREALGLGRRSVGIIRLSEFDEEGVDRFLLYHGAEGPLPSWLPRKPLLLGWLVIEGLLQPALEIDGSGGFGHVWDRFLSLIFAREGDRGEISPTLVSRIMKRLACYVRSTPSGTGPITEPDLYEAFRQETGRTPNEGALQQLQRLPGLTERGGSGGTRSFVDEDLLAALQGRALADAVISQAAPPQNGRWLEPISDRATAMAVHILRQSGLRKEDVLTNALHGDMKSIEDDQPFADAITVAIAMAAEEGEVFDGRGTTVEGGLFSRLDLEEVPIKRLTLATCQIDEVIVGQDASESSLRLKGCIINRVAGADSYESLPRHIFPIGEDESLVEDDNYQTLDTNNAVQAAGWPPRITALVVVLKKLFDQPGKRRRLNAFERGLTRDDVTAHVSAVLHALKQAGFVEIHGTTAHPVRAMSSRAHEIIHNPLRSTDPIAEAARS